MRMCDTTVTFTGISHEHQSPEVASFYQGVNFCLTSTLGLSPFVKRGWLSNAFPAQGSNFLISSIYVSMIHCIMCNKG